VRDLSSTRSEIYDNEKNRNRTQEVRVRDTVKGMVRSSVNIGVSPKYGTLKKHCPAVSATLNGGMVIAR